MKRKPDILWVLVLIFGLGLVTTGYSQVLWEQGDNAASMAPLGYAEQPGR